MCLCVCVCLVAVGFGYVCVAKCLRKSHLKGGFK